MRLQVTGTNPTGKGPNPQGLQGTNPTGKGPNPQGLQGTNHREGD